ncbi:MAG: hypothetical protein LBV71_17670 [Prevotella sp.]|jgi:hypothetical protein|nr:hypothetical protein [Prevotella sp.]
MTNLTKHTLEQTLNRIYETIKKATQEDYEEDNWYSDLLWQDELEDYFENGKGMNIEDTLAIDAVQYPELYPVIRQIIEGITSINNKYWNGPIDVDSEWSAGSFFAGQLAMASQEDGDILLFARHLATRDLDHEADPFAFFGVWEILNKMGYCEKTVPVLIALFFANSQHRGDNFTYDDVNEITTYLNEGNNLNNYLKELAAWEETEGNGAIEEMFELFLCEAMGLEDDQAEEAEEIFMEVLKEKRIPAKDDFESLK